MNIDPSSIMTKQLQLWTLNGNNYWSQKIKQLLQSLQLTGNCLIYFNIQISFKLRKAFCTFYLNKFLKLIVKLKMP
jgi:hypothetical protein